MLIQGRCLSPEDVALIAGWLADHPSWNRTRLSRELCLWWNWRNDAGRLKDMACRTLLLKLEALGRIVLPPRQTASVNGRRNRQLREVAHEQSPIEGELNSVRPLRVDLVVPGSRQADLFKWLLHRYHYLGHRNGVGENLQYLALDAQERPLACLLFGSAAWKTQARDRFIGWNGEERQRHLRWLTNNSRLLIVPWARVPHLASHLLNQVCRRLSEDWRSKYGHRIEVVESFVDRSRFAGTAYRAAGWIRVGQTRGRSRQDRDRDLQVPVKDVYLKPLSREYRRRLCS
jgi:Druantia protein DruA